MYRVLCDAEDCDASASDGTEYYAWNAVEGALNDAECAGWKIKPSSHFCEAHLQDVCSSEDCEETEGLLAAQDGWMYCIEHVAEGGGPAICLTCGDDISADGECRRCYGEPLEAR